MPFPSRRQRAATAIGRTSNCSFCAKAVLNEGKTGVDEGDAVVDEVEDEYFDIDDDNFSKFVDAGVDDEHDYTDDVRIIFYPRYHFELNYIGDG